jgi:Flp pilus assembly protein TadG
LSDERGSAALSTVLLLPLLLLVLATVADLGALRLAAVRARAAVDLAALAAVADQDPQALSRDGSLRLADDAEAVARRYVALNLAALGPSLAESPGSVAAAASVATFPRGGTDPLDGAAYAGPTVRVRADVPLRTGALARMLGGDVVVRARAAAAAQ